MKPFNVVLLLVVGMLFQAPLQAQDTDEDGGATENVVPANRPRWMAVPTIFYTPETRFAIGGAGAVFFQFPSSRSSNRVSQVLAAFIVTQNKQIISEISPDLFFRNEAHEVLSEIQFVRFPDKFYGIGRDAPEEAEESYTADRWRFHFEWLIRVHRSLYIGPNIGVLHQELIKTEEGGLLAGSSIPGVEGGLVTRFGAHIVWDRRDNINYTSRGSYLNAALMVADGHLGSDYDFIRYLIDARYFLPLPAFQTLAFQFYSAYMPGDVPFILLPKLGGPNRMRGYYEGRYRDHLYIMLQSEYRVSIWRWIGMVAFVSAGDVASSIRAFSPRTAKVAGGLGLRFSLSAEDRLNLRIDYGMGKNTSGIYITIQEAF